MNSLSIAISNILSPAVLFFILGAMASVFKSGLKIPETVSSMLTIYVLLSIGFRGGVSVNGTNFFDIILYIILAVIIGILVTFSAYCMMSKTGIDSVNAGSVAGHYGACSSVTITASIVFLQQTGSYFESFVPALYPFMDTAALVTAIILGHLGTKKNALNSNRVEYDIKTIIVSALTGRSTFLIIGGFLIGLVSSVEATQSLMFFYEDLFNGIFTIFMLDIGIVTGLKLNEIRKVKPTTFSLALILPPIHASIAIVLAGMTGLGPGGATVLATLAAGASVISAPAVMKDAFPSSNPSLGLVISLGIIFPFNVIIGIPLYYNLANLLV